MAVPALYYHRLSYQLSAVFWKQMILLMSCGKVHSSLTMRHSAYVIALTSPHRVGIFSSQCHHEKAAVRRELAFPEALSWLPSPLTLRVHYPRRRRPRRWWRRQRGPGNFAPLCAPPRRRRAGSAASIILPPEDKYQEKLLTLPSPHHRPTCSPHAWVQGG
ncbi:PREDICTED: uncharacterized protein LOC101363794 [Odobenus rosmarus divergens]|uniref:Uncharacterized protein LOC101363794 n=1 Tax=Odobenus rosmarus divergens TaxID=9708 RepID=A0A9B0GFL3_ODORO